MFKIIGAVLGFMLFGFWGILLGLFAGSSLDRFRAYGRGGVNPFTQGHRQTVFLQTIFTLKGHLAKVDGHISQAEIDHTEQFIRQLGMSTEHRQQAIGWFKQGAAADFDIAPALREFKAVCGHTHHLPQVLLVYLVVMALADGALDSAEEALLFDIARQLGYSDADFRRILEMTLNQSRFAGGRAATTASDLDDAYKALGVSKSCSDQELKHAYRKLMSQYHPDKLMGQGVPEDMIAVATEQAQEVQAAYEAIKRSRGGTA